MEKGEEDHEDPRANAEEEHHEQQMRDINSQTDGNAQDDQGSIEGGARLRRKQNAN